MFTEIHSHGDNFIKTRNEHRQDQAFYKSLPLTLLLLISYAYAFFTI
jgi:hypothetical protein